MVWVVFFPPAGQLPLKILRPRPGVHLVVPEPDPPDHVLLDGRLVGEVVVAVIGRPKAILVRSVILLTFSISLRWW